MADVELLPLPEWAKRDDLGGLVPSEVRAEMHAYARANVEHHTAAKDAEIEALRAEVERLQEIVRPKREDECLTLDHWRMRAYALEANWARCSHACAIEQDKREQAEARADKLAEALRELEERERRDEALLRQALEALSRAHQAAMVQTLKARIPECAEFAGIAQDLDFVVAALRERLCEGEQK